ncbi:MAG: trehalose-6-phosphate synthase [Chromatiales bacterium]
MSRLVVVSNRVAVPASGQPAPGGLAVGLQGALKEAKGLWFGWSGELTGTESGQPEVVRRGGVTYATIDINEKDYRGYYEGFSNNILWPLFHYQPAFLRYRRRYFEAYNRVNDLFAKRLQPLLEPDDLLWIHDYQLIPLGAALRRLGVDLPIGFFLHIPFPAYDLLRVLPVAKELFQSLCVYDLVGFQTEMDRAAFLENARMGLGAATEDDQTLQLGEHRVATGVFPIGIDVDEVEHQSRLGQGVKAAHRLTSSLHGSKLIIGADRLDYSKGLLERLRAYQRLLARYPDVHGQVVFLQIAQPSRTMMISYQEITRNLQKILGRINARYTHYDWVPIRYMEQSVGRQTLMGFFRVSHVGLVTPLRDGMNLVAKEYLAAQDPDDPGALVLSSLAGAAQELDSALIINPYDQDAVADAMQKAINMPLAERRERHSAALAVLRRNDIHAWRRGFIERLEAAARATDSGLATAP